MKQEQVGRVQRRRERAEASRQRLRRWFDEGNCPGGAVFTKPSSIAWVTGGTGQPVDRSAGSDPIWVVVNKATTAVITTEVELNRVEMEFDLKASGVEEVIAVPWFDPLAFVATAEQLLGSAANAISSDGHRSFGVDVEDELIALRLQLSAPEIEDLKRLGADAAFALESAVLNWRPGERDFDVQARLCGLLEERGVYAPIMIVGGDERVKSYRHPVAIGDPVSRLLMAVVVATRDGLHVAATRFASAGPLDAGLKVGLQSVLNIQDRVLSSCRPGTTYGSALAELDRAYEQEGFPQGWKSHYQGGPIGYEQREFEIAPCQKSSRWYHQVIETFHAVAWNPSLPGGAKAEDTYVVGEHGVERVTGSTAWPQQATDGAAPSRPTVLEV